MAFGDTKGNQYALTGASVGTSNALVSGANASVVVGDLVIVCFAQQTALTASGVTDNLGNTYTAANAGTDAGVVSGRFFYSRVTAAGTLTTVTVAATSSANDFSGVARVIEGPFDAADLIASTTPANTSNDLTSPFACPSSGALDNTGRSKLIVGWATHDNNVNWSATSPNTEVGESNRANAAAIISTQVVTGTTAVAPEFTGTNPAASVLGTIAFNGSLATGDGSAGGTGASSVVGAAIGSGDGSAGGTGASSVVGASTAASVASASGTGAANVVGEDAAGGGNATKTGMFLVF